MGLLLLLVLLVILAVTAQFWGADSRDNIDSLEWKRHARFWTTHHS